MMPEEKTIFFIMLKEIMNWTNGDRINVFIDRPVA